MLDYYYIVDYKVKIVIYIGRLWTIQYVKKIVIVMVLFLFLYWGTEKIFADSSILEKSAPKKLASASLIPRQIALEEKQPILASSRILDVPLLNQLSAPRLYNGCEVTSLAMLLNFYGYNVTKNELANKIKRVPLNLPGNKKGNPNVGFVGDMEDGPGLAVYNGPIFDLAKQYAGDKAVNLTGSTFDELLKMVNQGAPVWIITTTSFAPVSVFEKWETPQGTIEVTFSEHSVVITGYDEDSIYINDPYGYKNRKVDRENFIAAWKQMGRQAVTIDA